MSNRRRNDPLEVVLGRALWLVLLLGSAVRALLLGVLSPPQEPLTTAVVLIVGLGADLLVAASCALLVCATALVGQRLLRLALALIAFVLLLVSVAELFFWNEFQSRPDRLVFHYLSYPAEVLTFLEDQFFVSLYALPFLLLVYLVWRWLRAPLLGAETDTSASAQELPLDLLEPSAPAVTGPRAPLPGWRQGRHLLLIVGLGLAVSAIPLPTGRIAEQLATNGYLGIVQAALTDAARWQGHYPAVATTKLPLFRAQKTWQDPPKHLLLIIEESFAGETWRNPELRNRYLPNFTALANQGWHFTNVFATGSRTTRGMEALLNGMPPLPGVSTTQRERPERLPSLPRALGAAGWHSAFIYAGWPDFSNLSDYWRAIGFDDSTSREDFPADSDAFETSWGFADETLFERLLTEMNQRTETHEQVFLAALTVSNHRPFDYPAGRLSFPAEQRRSEFAMAYADWALGRFMQQARKQPWFDDTLFVIAGDHGPRFRGDASIPVNSYRVPLLIYAPQHTAPRTLTQLGSLMEVPATLLDLLGVADSEGFYGTHLLDSEQALVPVEHDYDVGLIDTDGVTVLRRNQAAERWDWSATGDDEALQPGRVTAGPLGTAATLFKQAHQRYFER